MKKRILSLGLTLIMAASVLCMPYSSGAATYKQELINAGFPESYATALVTLHEKYPNWVFKPFITGLDWQTAVDGERSPHKDQRLRKTSSRGDEYFCQCSTCKGKVWEGSGTNAWYSASESAVKYYMDPRNWLTEKYIFQFESTKYNSTHTQKGVEYIIASTWMKDADITYNSTESKTVTYKDANGKTVKYSQAIIDASKYSKMSAYCLASKIVQEVGSSTASYAGGSCGTRVPFVGIYNYYNYGAYSGASDGLFWASGNLKTNKATKLYPEYDAQTDVATGTPENVVTGRYASYIGTYGKYYKVKLFIKNSANSYTKDGSIGYILKSDFNTDDFNKYGRPWTNPYLSIYYGAERYASGYNTYQYTGYLQKFNVNKSSGELYGHEYMTNVDGASSEAAITYKAYYNLGELSKAKTFYIPVYKNMPAAKCKVTDASSDNPVLEPETKVTGLTLTGRTKETISLSWDKFTGATKYYIYIQNKTKGTAAFSKTVTTNSATLNGLTPANEYLIKVKAYTSSGYKDYSAAKTLHALPDKMAKPTVKSIGDTYANLTFSAMAGADGYYIYGYNKSKQTYVKLATVEDGKATSFKVTSLKSCTNYMFAISAYVVDEETREGAKSATADTKTKLLKVNLKSLTSPSTTKIKATWDITKGSESGYEIWYARDKDFKRVVAKKFITPKTTSTYTGKNFTKGVTYYVKVRTYKTVSGKKQYGSWSNVRSVKSK